MDGSSVMGAPNIGTPLVLESTFSIVSLGLGVSFFVVCFLWRGFCTPGRGVCAGSFSLVKSFLTPWVMFVQVCSQRESVITGSLTVQKPKDVYWLGDDPTPHITRGTLGLLITNYYLFANCKHHGSTSLSWCQSNPLLQLFFFRQNAQIFKHYSLKPFILYILCFTLPGYLVPKMMPEFMTFSLGPWGVLFLEWRSGGALKGEGFVDLEIHGMVRDVDLTL